GPTAPGRNVSSRSGRRSSGSDAGSRSRPTMRRSTTPTLRPATRSGARPRSTSGDSSGARTSPGPGAASMTSSGIPSALPSGNARLAEPRSALLRALEEIAAERSVDIAALVAAGDPGAAAIQGDKLWSLLRGAVDQGLPQDDLADAFARVSALLGGREMVPGS